MKLETSANVYSNYLFDVLVKEYTLVWTVEKLRLPPQRGLYEVMFSNEIVPIRSDLLSYFCCKKTTSALCFMLRDLHCTGLPCQAEPKTSIAVVSRLRRRKSHSSCGHPRTCTVHRSKKRLQAAKGLECPRRCRAPWSAISGMCAPDRLCKWVFSLSTA